MDMSTVNGVVIGYNFLIGGARGRLAPGTNIYAMCKDIYLWDECKYLFLGSVFIKYSSLFTYALPCIDIVD